MRYNVFLFIFLFVALFGCTDGRNIRGIKVSQEMIDGGDMKGIDYCLLYEHALDGDISSIRDYSTIETFNGGFIYVHGIYLIRLIDRIGDNNFLKAIEGIDVDQKARICLYIEGGMDIYEWYPTGEGAIGYASVEDYWNKHPKICSFVKKRGN